MKVGLLILPEERWSVASERWRTAERLGFDHAWTYDHLTWRTFRNKTWFGALPTLAAAAVVTRAIRLGTLVASPNFRHPVPFAKELMTLDDLSQGRFTLGFGAGAESFDATALGQAPWSRRERAERFEEFVTLLDRLLTNREVSHAGRYYSARDARNVPGCVQQPRIPFALAATGPHGMRLTARFAETWVWVDGRGVIEELVRQLDEVCAASGRPPKSLQRLALLGFETRIESVEEFRRARDRFRKLGFTDLVIHWPRGDEPFRGDESLLEHIAPEK
jgi:alkanesulfonate monooxygenase SsuD/methylene tetrahydromethanopterin reductase-like flavin-dependent oxidoreductase (luciferase family)